MGSRTAAALSRFSRAAWSSQAYIFSPEAGALPGAAVGALSSSGTRRLRTPFGSISKARRAGRVFRDLSLRGGGGRGVGCCWCGWPIASAPRPVGQ